MTIQDRILQISYKKGLSHIGSCLSAAPIIDQIYQRKASDEKFVLSCGHAALALYCVLEKNGGKNAEDIFDHHGVHPDYCVDCGLDCSSGSLGHGLGIAVGMALSDRSKNTYCLISDGECSEGSIWEALRIQQEQKLNNLKIYLNFNGWGAYKTISRVVLFERLSAYSVAWKETDLSKYPFLQGQDAHYCVLKSPVYTEKL